MRNLYRLSAIEKHVRNNITIYVFVHSLPITILKKIKRNTQNFIIVCFSPIHTGKESTDSELDIDQCRQELHNYYINSLCKIPLIPGDMESCVALDDIYTQSDDRNEFTQTLPGNQDPPRFIG